MLTTAGKIGLFGCSLACIGGFGWLCAYLPHRPLALSLAASPLLALSLWTGYVASNAPGGRWYITVPIFLLLWTVAASLAFAASEETGLWRDRTEALLTHSNPKHRIWAASRARDARRVQALLSDAEPSVREAAVRSVARAAPFLEAIEVLKSAFSDPDFEVRRSAFTCFWDLGGDLLNDEWLGIYRRLQGIQESDRRVLDLSTAYHRGGTTKRTEHSGATEIYVETTHSFHDMKVPSICCLCAFNIPTVWRERTWHFSREHGTENFGLSLSFCRLCAHSDLEKASVRVESVQHHHGGLDVKMSFLNAEVIPHFRRANSR